MAQEKKLKAESPYLEQVKAAIRDYGGSKRTPVSRQKIHRFVLELRFGSQGKPPSSSQFQRRMRTALQSKELGKTGDSYFILDDEKKQESAKAIATKEAREAKACASVPGWLKPKLETPFVTDPKDGQKYMILERRIDGTVKKVRSQHGATLGFNRHGVCTSYVGPMPYI
jgi:hypothetical protein